MEQQTKTILTFAFLIIVLFGLYFFSDWFSKTTGYAPGEDEKLKLVLCLNAHDAVFYRSATCPDCDEQLELFGAEAAKFVNVINCESVDNCPAGGVPAWKIGTQTHYGVKRFDELISVSGCAVG